MIVALVCLALALVPVAMLLWNLSLYTRPASATEKVAVSVLIPARNEEANIAEAVACVLASRGVDVELIVLDDASTDRTPEILRAIDDPRLRVAEAPPLPPEWSGKQHACMQLARLASHELMVFVDADVRLAPDAVARMAGFMQRNAPTGLASGFPRQITVTWSEWLLLPLIMFLLLGFLPIGPMRRSLAPGFGAGCGQLFIARRTAYARTGGHSAIRASLHDGITLPRAFRKAGFATDLFDASGFATCRMYSSAAQVWEGLTKNATEGMAKWRALPIWTLVLGGGQVVPVLLLLTPYFRIAALALVLSFAARMILAVWFRQDIRSVVLHPLGVAALLVVQWAALLRAARGGRATWRGRSYQAQG
jgi:glycosyltransferase involved in cell wall biosynthesis